MVCVWEWVQSENCIRSAIMAREGFNAAESFRDTSER